MNLSTVEIVVALVGSVLLLLQVPGKLFPAVLLLASGLEALLSFRIIQLSIKGLNLWLVLGAILAVVGAVVWARNTTKASVTAATAVALVGAVQVFSALS